MKKTFRLFAIIAALTVITSLNLVQAQPNPGQQSGGGSTGGAPISGAPVGSGEIFLFALAALYGARKAYGSKMEKEN